MEISGSQVDEKNSSNLTEGELLKRRKERKKRRQARLIQGLEKKRFSTSNFDIEKVSGKKRKTVFQTQEETESRKPFTGRNYTVSLAVPGSILDNTQTAELRTYLAGQVARALAVFCVDEVIVFDDEGTLNLSETSLESEFSEVEGNNKSHACTQLARILQFLECPQYLRRSFFPIHPDLKYAGVLNPTDMPHHLRKSEVSEFRDGIVLDKTDKKRIGSLVDIGLKKECLIDKPVPAGVRVTVEVEIESEEKNLLRGRVVAPSTPRTSKGLYWGYFVRLAEKFSHVFTKCPFKGGYDLTVGTSERGQDVDSSDLKREKPFNHLLVVFGGVKGLEVAVANDPEFSEIKDKDPSGLFDVYLNTCPNQGSRTIRTEEAILVTLASLRPKILAAQNLL